MTTRRFPERRRHARPRSALPELEINLAENWQIRWWCAHFRVTHRELFAAIAVVGISAEAVRRELEAREEKRRARTRQVAASPAAESGGPLSSTVLPSGSDKYNDGPEPSAP